MNILFLSQLFPYPLDSGAKIKTYHTLRLLSRRHRITFFTFFRSERERAFLPELERFCQEVKAPFLPRSRSRDGLTLLGALARKRSFVVERDFAPEMKALVEDALARERFEVIHADRLQMAQYVPEGSGAVLVLDEHNVESEILYHLANRARGLRRALLILEYRNLRRFEAQACARFQHIICVTEGDRRGLEALQKEELGITASAQMHVVPIGVDCARIRPLNLAKEESRLLFLGPLNWPPNADAVMWFVREIWPRIRRRKPQAGLRIIGAHAPRSLRKLAPTAGIELAGYVEEILPELCRAQAMVVPLRAGSGLRVKILTAMAAGLAVVSTAVGCAGIEATGGKHFLLADTCEEFAQAVISLLENPALRCSLEEAGRQLVLTRYDWSIVHYTLQEVYDSVETQTRAPLPVS